MLLKLGRRLSAAKAILAVLLLAVILRVLFIWARYPGNDEPYTLDWVSNGLGHFIEVIFKDTSPPLFYFLAFLFNALMGIYGFYLLVIIFGVLSIVMLYKITLFLFDKKVALLSAFLLCISTMHVLYSQHLRPYSFVQFLVLAAIYVSLLYLKDKKRSRLFWLSILFLITALTYYPATVPFVLIYAYLAFKEIRAGRKPFLLIASFIPAPVAFGAFYLFFSSQIANALAHKYPFPLFENFFYFFYKHFAGINLSTSISMFPWAIILGIILCIFFVLGLWKVLSSKKFFLPYLIFGSIAIYYAAFFKFNSIVYFKHMSAIMPLIFIFPAIGLLMVERSNKKIFWILLAVIILLSLASLVFYYYVITSYEIWTPLIGH